MMYLTDYAVSVTRFLGDIVALERAKPRSIGLTMMLDRIGYANDETMNYVRNYVDIAKIGWGLPFLLDQMILKRRIDSYKRAKVNISNGGTLLELCISKGKEDQALRRLLSIGFDTIELSEGVTDVSLYTKKKVAEFAHSNNLRLHVEVGKKDPRNQIGLEETVSRIEASFDLEPNTVIVEGRESGKSVGIYDDSGNIKWDWVERLEQTSKPSTLMFEAPQEAQQTELIIHLSSEVNLGNVSMPSVAALETQRQGLRGDTFGISRGSKKITGGPAAKFIFFVISSHNGLDQSKLMRLTGLNRRTVQEALKRLAKQGAVKEAVDISDMRRKIYSA